MTNVQIAKSEVAKDEFLRTLADAGLTAQEAHETLIELANKIGYACNDVKLSTILPIKLQETRVPTSRTRFVEAEYGSISLQT